MKRIRCTPCGGTGREPIYDVATTGPWTGRTTRACGTCMGKGWNPDGKEIHVGRC